MKRRQFLAFAAATPALRATPAMSLGKIVSGAEQKGLCPIFR